MIQSYLFSYKYYKYTERFGFSKFIRIFISIWREKRNLKTYSHAGLWVRMVGCSSVGYVGNTNLKLDPIREEDFKNTAELLCSLGYNFDNGISIHKQFCKKHNLSC